MSTDESLPQILGADTAPVIFTDGVAAFGTYNGIIEMEMATRVLTPKHDGSTRGDMLVVGRLRLTAAGFAALKDAIQKIELMLAPSDQKPN